MRKAIEGRGWIDVSVELRDRMVNWPGDPAVRIFKRMDMAQGHECNVTQLRLGAHTGTHLDAPRHFIADGLSVDYAPLAALIGRARVIEVRDPVSIEPDELRACCIRRGERLLFKTPGATQRRASDRFARDYVHLSVEAAQYLAQRRVRLVGIDYLSVGPFKQGSAEAHIALLGAGVWLIEGLDLSRVKAGAYELLCLPLRIAGADGAPARALLRPWR